MLLAKLLLVAVHRRALRRRQVHAGPTRVQRGADPGRTPLETILGRRPRQNDVPFTHSSTPKKPSEEKSTTVREAVYTVLQPVHLQPPQPRDLRCPGHMGFVICVILQTKYHYVYVQTPVQSDPETANPLKLLLYTSLISKSRQTIR